jgi:glycosyltransferase involved in cell wall biosynthesis
LNVLQISTYDIDGGAARAASRVHQSLLQHGNSYGVNSRMRVMVKKGHDPLVMGGYPDVPRSVWRRLDREITALRLNSFHTGNPVWHTLAWVPSGLGSELEKHCASGLADILHFHWVGDNAISIEEIGNLQHPVLWTLHDQWAFCGAEHYVTPPGPQETCSTDERFVLGYLPANRPAHESGPDLNRETWLRKRRAWRKPMHIVCPSHWMADCARRSALMKDWPISVIPNPIDLEFWAPVDQNQARWLLQLPSDRCLLLFGAFDGTKDSRKGADLLYEALQILRCRESSAAVEKLEVLVFGQDRPENAPHLGFPVHYTGRIQDDLRLRLLYSAADAFVIPSRQDNLPNTGLEAHACGTPVVAFRTGGLVDIVDDQKTGALAKPFDSHSLAESIEWVLQSSLESRQLGVAARQKAELEWGSARVASLYANKYLEMITH